MTERIDVPFASLEGHTIPVELVWNANETQVSIAVASVVVATVEGDDKLAALDRARPAIDAVRGTVERLSKVVPPDQWTDWSEEVTLP